jgi:hypothetical protein
MLEPLDMGTDSARSVSAEEGPAMRFGVMPAAVVRAWRRFVPREARQGEGEAEEGNRKQMLQWVCSDGVMGW